MKTYSHEQIKRAQAAGMSEFRTELEKNGSTMSENSRKEGNVEIWEDADMVSLLAPKERTANKGDFGTVSIVAGYGSFGAPLLATGSALKSGAGYTKLCLPSDLFTPQAGLLLAVKYPACIFRCLEIGDELLVSNAIAFGMGAGVGERQYETVTELLTRFQGTLILDADALNCLSRYGKEPLKEKKCRAVLTPHPMEFSRLTGKSLEELLFDPAAEAEAFAREYDVCVAFKNSISVITDGERTALNCTGSPALAKGGSGDVLSGLIAGSCARGLAPFEGTVLGCYLLGRAGEEAEARFGQYAPDASDVIACLPAVMKRLAR